MKLVERWLEVARSKAEAGADDDGADTQAGGEGQREDVPKAKIAAVLAITRAVLTARRDALIAERDAERLDDEILRELLEDIDLEQAVVARRSHHAS